LEKGNVWHHFLQFLPSFLGSRVTYKEWRM
jgi:hypothetical protein